MPPNRTPLPSPPLEVAVPASTSNLGPGFDFLGLALSLQLRIRWLGASASAEHAFETLTGTAVDWPRGQDNAFFCALDRACELWKEPLAKMRFEATSEIPIARGLGSSGAAIAAGLLFACKFAGRRVDLDELLALGLELEGHPDNSSAALVGGCTLSVPRPHGGVCVVQQALHQGLAFALAWPARRIATIDARAVLPRSVRFADAVENPRRLALLLEGLRTADPELLALGSEDRLHVARRLPLIPGGAAALAAARENGAWLATISGSGSALVAIGAHDRVLSIGLAMASELRRVDGEAWSRVVTPVFGTPAVLDHAVR